MQPTINAMLKRLLAVAVAALLLAGAASAGAARSQARLALRQLLRSHDDSSPEIPGRPCFVPNGGTYFTATTACNASFQVAFVSDQLTRAAGPDSFHGPSQHVWVGQTLASEADTAGTYIAVLCQQPQEQQQHGGSQTAVYEAVVPKAVRADGSLVDISHTKATACLLFQAADQRGDGMALGFAPFRMILSGNGSSVVSNDFRLTPSNTTPVACEQYFETEGGRVVRRGKLVDVYLPGGCRFAVDDCGHS